MKVIGNIDIFGKASGAFAEYDDYPTNPKIGTWAMIKKSLMMCISVDELPVWIPLSPERNTKVFEQETPSDRWVVDHELGSENVILQCFDSTNNVIQPSSINPIDSMSTEIVLPEAMTGKVVVMFGYTDGVSTNAPDAGNQSKEVVLFTTPKSIGNNSADVRVNLLESCKPFKYLVFNFKNGLGANWVQSRIILRSQLTDSGDITDIWSGGDGGSSLTRGFGARCVDDTTIAFWVRDCAMTLYSIVGVN